MLYPKPIHSAILKEWRRGYPLTINNKPNGFVRTQPGNRSWTGEKVKDCNKPLAKPIHSAILWEWRGSTAPHLPTSSTGNRTSSTNHL